MKKEKTAKKKKNNNTSDEKRPKRLIIIASVSVAVIALSVFFGVFFGIRNKPENRFNRAEKAWSQAENKKAEDKITVFFAIGEVEEPLVLRIEMTGTRTFTGAEIKYVYTASVNTSLFGGSLSTLYFNAVSNGGDIRLNYREEEDGIFELEPGSIIIPKDELADYDLNRYSIYDMSNKTLSGKKGYNIAADNSLSFLNSAVLALFTRIFNAETPSLEQYYSFGSVRGDIEYSKGGFEKITSTQSFSINMPWEKFDEAFKDVEMSEKMRKIVDDKEIIHPMVTIDFYAYCPHSLVVNARAEIVSTFS